MSAQLRSKTISAVKYLGIGTALSKVFSLVTTIMLARILSPQEYGTMAIAVVVIGFIGFFNEVGIGSAIVQKQEPAQEELNGCFAIALLISSLLFTAMIALSEHIAAFFGAPQLAPMMPIMASVFILGAFSTVPLAMLRKEMEFKAISAVMMLSVIVQSLLCLFLAMAGYGVWSLAWGFVASSLVQSLGAFFLSPWRPKGRYGIREATDLVKYGLHVTYSRIFWYLYSNVDKVVIGRFLGERSLGIYDMAFGLATLPSGQITSLVTNISSPVFAKLQDDLKKMATTMLGLTRSVAYLTYPALIGMLVCSRELVAVFLGEKWMDMLVPFSALCLMGLFKSVDPLLSQLLIGTGHAKKLSAYTALCGIVMSLAITAGALLDGLLGVSIAWAVVYPLLSAKLTHDACRITGIRMRDYYKNLMPVLMGATAMGLLVALVREALIDHVASIALMLSIEVLTGILGYACWIIFLDRRGLNEILETLRDAGIPVERLNRWLLARKPT